VSFTTDCACELKIPVKQEQVPKAKQKFKIVSSVFAPLRLP